MSIDSSGTAMVTLCSKTQEGQELGDVHQTFRFASFGRSQRLPLILLVQQRLETSGHSSGQAKFRQVAGHFDFKLDGL